MKMIDYDYEALDAQGKHIRGSCRAIDEAGAVSWCRQHHLYIINLTQKQQRGLRRRTLKSAEQILLFKRLSVLLKSGIGVKESLESCQSKGNALLNDVLTSSIGELENGSSLAEAFARQRFAPLICAAIHSGELSGSLPEVLAGLAERLEQEKRFRDKFWQTMLYPGFVGLACLLCFSVLLLFAVPEFCDTFSQLGGTLPPGLQLLAGIRENAELCCTAFGILFSGVFLVIWWSHQQGRLDSWLLRLPVIGSCMLKRELTMMASFSAMMLKSGIPLSEVLTQQIAMDSNRCLQKSWCRVREKILSGSSFHLAIQEEAIIPELFSRFIAVGESSGRLDDMLSHAAAYYMQELTVQLAWLNRILEPVLMLLAGIFVLLLVLAMLLPSFSLLDQILLF